MGVESNYADIITKFCKTFLLPRYKFLKEGWHEYDPNRSDSLLSLVKWKVAIPESTDNEGLWERVVVPTNWLNFINMKCNLNNEIKKVYCTFDPNWQLHPWISRIFVAPSETIVGLVKKISSPTWGMVWKLLLAKICLVVDYLTKSTFTYHNAILISNYLRGFSNL